MGANGNRPQEACHRGHTLSPANTKPGTGGGRRCKACECALSAQHNARVRHGILWTKEQFEQYADAKYTELRASARS